jgi:hypothetical protein
VSGSMRDWGAGAKGLMRFGHFVEAATKKVKKVAEEMKGKAAERKGEVRGKSSEIAGGAKERKEEVK